MVQTPFTWRYGGNQVFLSGSFNGWSERIAMVLVEGSRTIFQRIIDLPPGCYQYKFLVDGTWRIDQHQICDQENNIVLVTETEFLSTEFSNADALQPSTSQGSSSGGPHNEQFLRISDGEMDALRRVLSMHLLSTTIYELIPISGKGLTVVPLWDENDGQMAGMLTASDFILILLQLQRNRAAFAIAELQAQTISSWKSCKLQHHRDIIGTTASIHRRPLIHAGPDESLADVASKILQNNISAVPVIYSVNGSNPRLLHIVCLSRILKNICSHFQHHLGYLNILQQPVGYLPLGTWAVEFRRATGRPLLILNPNDTLSSALTLLLEAQISSIPIVDHEGNFVNIYSRGDIISLAYADVYTAVQLNQMTVSQALELTGERGRNRYQTCTRFDSLYRVMERLSEPDVRRVIVIEASTLRVEGIITLREVFRFFAR
ncbi:hypothetical protein ABFX02_09G079200 [Erythranthe guttata]